MAIPMTRMDIPMLSVDPGKMNAVNTSSVADLTSLWGVFNKCSNSLEDGKRLQNLSWRLLSRKVLCDEYQPTPTPCSNSATPVPCLKHVPDLSTSTSTIATQHSCPRVSGRTSHQPTSDATSCSHSPKISLASSSERDKSLPPLNLEKMVSSIQEKHRLEPLPTAIIDAVPKLFPTDAKSDAVSQNESPTIINAPLQSSDSSQSTAPHSDSERSSRPSVGSDTSAELQPCHSVVRGFSPSQDSSSFRSQSHLSPAPVPTTSILMNKPETNKKGGGFLLGGSSGEDESSFEDRMHSQPKQSSLTAGLRRPPASKKTLSFRDIVESRKQSEKAHEDEEVFESDDESEMSDSAIDDSEEEVDDDDGEWEDDASEDVENKQPLFQRVDSQPNLVSRRSLLTSLMHQGDRAAAFQDMAANSAPGLRRSKTSTHMPTQEESIIATNNLPRTPSKPILRVNSDLMSLVSSPKTTRRNMLSTEIDENLRKSILHERLQKKSTLNAYTKRVQSARNLTTLPIHPEEPPKTDEEGPIDPYAAGIGAYHQAGW